MQVHAGINMNEKVAIYASYLFPIIIILISLLSIFNDMMIQPNMKNVVLDLIFLLLGISILTGVHSLHHKFRLNLIAEKEFRELLLKRFEPVVKEVVKYQILIDELSKKVDFLNRKVDFYLKEGVRAPARPFYAAPNLSLMIKSLYLAIITLGAIIFMYIKISPNSIYIVLILTFFWWYLITDEYNLFRDTISYVFIIFPILVIPILSIVFLAYFDLYTLHMFLFSFLVVYVLLYYAVATYYSTGRIPLLEKPPESGNNIANGGRVTNGGEHEKIFANEVEFVKRILDSFIKEKEEKSKERNGGVEKVRNGGLHVKEDKITLELDKDTFAEILAMYLIARGYYSHPQKPFTERFSELLMEKIKEFIKGLK